MSEIRLLCTYEGCGNDTKIIDDQPMRRMSECRVRFGHCGRSFISPAIYKSASAKIIAISGSGVPSLDTFPQCVCQRCPSASASFVSKLIDVFYDLRSYSTARAEVCCCVSLSL